VNTVIRAYDLLLTLYPAAQRAWFGAEMSVVFKERLTDWQTAGHRTPSKLVVSEFSALIRDVACAWLCQIRHSVAHAGSCGCVPDFRKMRPPWTDAKFYYRMLRPPRK
jgi:hypothetical protein